MPTTFSSVDEFLAAQSPERRAQVETLRALVRKAVPEVVELIKWNSPSYTFDGVDRLTINAQGKGAVRLVLHFGTARAEEKDVTPTFDGDPHGILTWHSNIRATLAAPDADSTASERASIVDVIRAWIAQP